MLFDFSFQDDTEVRVFEDENTGENEKIVEISTGPKGIQTILRYRFSLLHANSWRMLLSSMRVNVIENRNNFNNLMLVRFCVNKLLLLLLLIVETVYSFRRARAPH